MCALHVLHLWFVMLVATAQTSIKSAKRPKLASLLRSLAGTPPTDQALAHGSGQPIMLPCIWSSQPSMRKTSHAHCRDPVDFLSLLSSEGIPHFMIRSAKWKEREATTAWENKMATGQENTKFHKYDITIYDNPPTPTGHFGNARHFVVFVLTEIS